MELTPHPLAWHHTQWQKIAAYEHSNRFPHGLLLFGQRGMGKSCFAKALIFRLLCLAQDDNACGQCQSCRALAQDRHPDFIHIAVEKNKKVITVEQIRDCINKLMLKPAFTRRVVWVEQVELMNLAASNALLKSLEEPRGEAIYIFTAARPHLLPKTILSRCQLIYFPPATHEQCITHLKSLQLETRYAPLLRGAPLLAHDILSPDQLALREQIQEDIIQLVQHKCCALRVSDRWLQHELMTCLQVLYDWHVDVFKLKLDVDIGYLLEASKIEKLLAYSSFMHYKQIVIILEKLTEFIKQVSLNRQINTAIWLDDIAIEIACAI